METLIKRTPTQGLSLERVPLPELGPFDVLIRILKTSLCGTDLAIYQWNPGLEASVPLPVIIGHEFVGEIVELGKEVRGFSLGQIVSGETSITCGRCRYCLQGSSSHCSQITYTGVTRPGAFAEYIALPASAVWVYPSMVDLELATLFEPLGNAVCGLSQVDLLGKAVFITGASSEGMMAAAVCRHAGARQVVVLDQHFEKLRLALTLGATHVINVEEDDIDETMQGLGLEEGFDIVLEMSGNPAAYPLIFDHICHKGQVVMVGTPDAPQPMDWRSVIFKQLTIKGAYVRAMPETWQQVSALIEGGLDISPIITKRLHYTQFDEAFERLALGLPGKVIMDWGMKL